MALSAIYGLMAAHYGVKNPPTTAQSLRAWGLTMDADEIERQMAGYREKSDEMALKAFFGA